MTAAEMVYIARGKPEIENVEDVAAGSRCCLCGQEITGGVALKNAVSANFNNYDLFAAPESGFMCAPCAYTLSQELRRTSYICTEHEYIPLKREEIAEHLFAPPDEPFIFCVTSSYKKHLILRAVVNYGGEYSVVFDDMTVLLRQQDRQIFDAMSELYSVFTKDEIKTGDYKLHRLKKVNLVRFEMLEAFICGYRGTPGFSLMLYVLNKEEEREWDLMSTRVEKEQLLF